MPGTLALFLLDPGVLIIVRGLILLLPLTHSGARFLVVPKPLVLAAEETATKLAS